MTLTERFASFFDREVAQNAAKSISNGSEMEFRTPAETFTFTRSDGKNAIVPGPAKSPQLVFTMTEKAALGILDYPSNDIGEIGVHIAKMVISTDPDVKISIQFKAGFLG